MNTLMLEAEIKSVEKISKEVTLPYHCKDWLGRFCRVNTNGSVVIVYAKEGYATMAITDKEHSFSYMEDIINATPCPASEVEEAILKTIPMMDEILITTQA